MRVHFWRWKSPSAMRRRQDFRDFGPVSGSMGFAGQCRGRWVRAGRPDRRPVGFRPPAAGRASSRVSHGAATGSRPMANALTSVPSTEKWSSDSSGVPSRCAGIAAMTLLDIAVASSRSRFPGRRRSACGRGLAHLGLKFCPVDRFPSLLYPYRIISPEVNVPTKQQIILQLLHQLPLQADRIKDQAYPDRPLSVRSRSGRNRHRGWPASN